MIRKVVTAQDGNKTLSIEYNPISKQWKHTNRHTTPICSQPSDRTLVKVEKFSPEERKQKLNDLRLYLRDNFSDARYDLKPYQNLVYMAVCRDCNQCEDVELEVFSLARLLSLYTERGLIIDWGRRKTTFVEIDGGLFKSFRVVLRGGDHIDRTIAQTRNLTLQEAENLKKAEGLSIPEVREVVEETLRLSGYRLGDQKVLLTGGGSRLKGLKDLFPQTIELTHCEPEHAVCLGACLREVLKNPYPDFKRKELSPQDIRRFTYAAGLVLLGFFLSFSATKRLFPVEALKEEQRTEFKKLFPNEPIISLQEQVRSKVSTSEDYRLTKLFISLQRDLRPGMKLYRFEYADGRLLVRGEADRKLVEGMDLPSLKTTPTGTVEFEMRAP